GANDQTPTANTATPVLAVRVPLSMVAPHTLFALNKSVPQTRICRLRIDWSPSGSIYYIGTSETNPTTGAAAGTGDVTISEIKLFMTYEKDGFLKSQILQMANSESGFNCLVDNLVVSKKNQPESTVNVVDAVIPKAKGARLKRIYHAINHETESSNTTY